MLNNRWPRRSCVPSASPSGLQGATKPTSSSPPRRTGTPDEAAVEQVVICATDNDFAQCVQGDRVVMLDRIRRRVTNAAGVVERFGVDPDQIPDLFALVGDRSDGLPGVPGWGRASAAAVLRRYRRLEDIPADPSTWAVTVRGSTRLAASLHERWDEALLCRDLSVLRTDLPVRSTVAELEWRGASRPAIDAVVAQLGDATAVERITRWQDEISTEESGQI